MPFSLFYHDFQNPLFQFWENNVRFIQSSKDNLASAAEFELGWQLDERLSLLSSLFYKWEPVAQSRRTDDQLLSLVLDYKTGGRSYQLYTHYVFGDALAAQEALEPYWIAHAKITWNWINTLTPYLEVRNLGDVDYNRSSNNGVAQFDLERHMETRLGLNWSY